MERKDHLRADDRRARSRTTNEVLLTQAERSASPKAAVRAAPDQPASNVLEVTVGELSSALKRTIEDRFGFVRLRGEISNYRGPHSSGHAYFCLKDDAARIDAVIWKTAFLRLKTKPQEGLEVIATGRVTTFPGKSTYQIVVEAIEPAGIGALMALLEARRKVLASEGLFGEDRKRPLPFLPVRVGVVTSPTGAVIRDILHRIEDRFPRDVLVWPVRVQGETAAAEIVAAVDGFNALDRKGTPPRPDVIIVARGGGSLEDLWAFNEEIVVRAVAAGTIPLISAVGHETDWTLIDHVADLRAPTPSGAAEKAVPVRADLLVQMADLARRHEAGILRSLGQRRHELRTLARVLPGPASIIAIPRQRLDRAESRLSGTLTAGHDRRHLDLVRLSHRLAQQAPLARLAQKKHELISLEQRIVFCLAREKERRAGRMAQSGQRLASLALALGRDLRRAQDARSRVADAVAQAWSTAFNRRNDQLARAGRLLETLGYKQVLARGFALVRDADGRPLRCAADIHTGGKLDIEFTDGHIAATVASRSTRAIRPAPTSKTQQGSLF